MTSFKYTGTIPWVASIRYQNDGKWTVMDVNMGKDDIADLPEETATVKWMAASGKLQPQNVDPKAQTTITK